MDGGVSRHQVKSCLSMAPLMIIIKSLTTVLLLLNFNHQIHLPSLSSTVFKKVLINQNHLLQRVNIISLIMNIPLLHILNGIFCLEVGKERMNRTFINL